MNPYEVDSMQVKDGWLCTQSNRRVFDVSDLTPEQIEKLKNELETAYLIGVVHGKIEIKYAFHNLMR